MIVNRKTVDPTDPSSPEVVQLETAMGAAIGVFEGAGAVHVPRDRFVPVKKTNDLLVVRSDAYALARRLDGAARRPQREGDAASRRARLRLLQADRGTSRSASPRRPPSLAACRPPRGGSAT